MDNDLIKCVAFLDYEESLGRYKDYLKDPTEYRCKKSDNASLDSENKNFGSFIKVYTDEVINRLIELLKIQDPEDVVFNPTYISEHPFIYRFQIKPYMFEMLKDAVSVYGLCRTGYKNYRIGELRFELDYR